MGKSHQVSITPDPTLMEDIGSTSFTVAEAIVELVANSMDAKLDDSNVEIDVLIDQPEIRVVDDARGMTSETLSDAIRLGVKMDHGDSEGKKGMFGLGMKTACASLGERWSVTTRPLEEEEVEYFVEFDLAEWSQSAGQDDFEWVAEIEEREPDSDGVLGTREHGTAIVINKLRDYNPLPGPVIKKLGRAYKGHIESGDVIQVNGTKAQPPEYDFIEGSRVEIEESCGENDEHTIYGWVALDKQTHNDEFFGLNLYREEQLIEPWNKDWFAPHLMTSRVIGEVHLDFVPPNFYKRGFEKQSDEWKIVSETMEEVLEPVVKASRKASRGKDDKKFRKAARGLQEAMGNAEETPDEEEGSDDENSGEDAGGSEKEAEEAEDTDDDEDDSVEVQERTITLEGGETVRLSYELAELPDDQLPWDYIYDEESDEVQAILNTGSSLLEASTDHEILGKLALADCVASFLVDEMSYEPLRARRIRNRWLNNTLEE